MPAPATRILFLGLDGGTMSMLAPVFERGWMPHLAALWRRSATGNLRSSTPMVTPVAWTNFSTGCLPPTHGIHEFYHADSAGRSICPNDAGRVKVPTLWEIFARMGRSVISLNLPMTYPAPEVSGLVVAGSDAPGLEWAFAQCADFGREVMAALPEYTHKILWKTRPRRFEDLQAVAARTCSVFRAQALAAERADARVPDWTAMMVHFHNLDSLQHRLWPYLELDDTAEGQPEWTSEVVGCLSALDEAAARLMDLASQRDAAVIAVSDHGFGPCRALVNVNGLLRGAGLQRGLTYGTRFRYRFNRLRDRLHRWSNRNNPEITRHRLPRSIDGEVGCDWRRTVAYAPFGQLSGCIFLTPEVKANASRASRLEREITDLLLDVRDPETGLALFSDAFCVAERYGVDPDREGLPHVLAPSCDGFQAQSKWSAFDSSLCRADWALPATHYEDGVVAIDAPDVRPGGHLDANLHDLAPTTLALLGLEVPETMEGRVLLEAFETPLTVSARRRAPMETGPALLSSALSADES